MRIDRKTKRAVLSAAVVAAASGLTGADALAADRFWEGTFSTNWGTAQNWRFQQQPGALDRAVFIRDSSGFPVARTSVDLTFDNTIGSMLINDPINAGGYTLSTSGNGLLRVSGTADVDSDPGTANPVTFDSFDTLIGGDLNTFKFVNLTIQNGSLIDVAGQTRLQEDSQLFVNGSTLFSQAFTVTQRAQGHINSGGRIDTFDLSINSITPGEAAGVLNVNSGGTLRLFGATAGIHDVTAGTLNLNGTGTIHFNNSGGDLGINGSSSRLNLNRDFNLLNNARIQVINGGDVAASTFFDVGNGGTGRLFVDGPGSTVTSADLSDWGRGAGASATVNIQNGAVATYGSMRVGTSDGAATVSVFDARLQMPGSFEMGGGSANRNVSLGVSGSNGSFSVGGAATFNNKAVLNMAAGNGSFNGGATFNVGSTLNWTGGNINVASGQNWTVNGGVVNRNNVSAELSNGATLRVINGGQFTGTGFFDIARNNSAGSLIISGPGSFYESAGGFSDWGFGVGRTANVQISDGGIALIDSLRLGTNDAAATFTMSTNGVLATTGNFEMGGGATVRNVVANINGGTMEVQGTGFFNDKAVVNQTGGTMRFFGNASFNTGATYNRTGGNLVLSPNSRLTFAGGVGSFSNNGANYTLPNGATIAVTNGGRLDLTSFVDVANGVGSGTLLVDGTNSRFTAGGVSGSDWGRSSGDVATVTFSNNGAGTISSDLRVGTNGGTAHLNIATGGNLNVTGELTAGGPASTANINISGGSLNSINTAEFRNGSAVNVTGSGLLRLGGNTTFTTGSTFNSPASAGLELADNRTLAFDGGAGTVQFLSNGVRNGQTLRVTNGGQFTALGGLPVALAGNGTLFVDGPNSKLISADTNLQSWGQSGFATVTFANGGAGTYNGSLQIGVAGSATVNIQSGGLLHAKDIDTTFLGGTARINVNGGTLRTTEATFIEGGATLNYAAGTVNIGGKLTVGDLGNGQVLLTSGGDKVLRTGGLAITGASKIDLNDNDMIVGSISTSKSQVANFIKTARNGGAWNGTSGITSTAAKNKVPPNTTLGTLTGQQYASAGGGALFSGQTYLPTDTLVKYTYYGDTDFNGVINFDDYARVDGGFLNGGNEWFEGDLNTDNVVNFDDYALIDGAFLTQSGTLRPALMYLAGDGSEPDMAGQPSLQMVVDHFERFGSAYANSLFSAVPEPTTAVLAAAATGACLMRGRQRRRSGR